MMGFIAYAQNIENTVKLMTCSKLIQLNEPHEKNRIFVTGHSMMSTKISSSEASINKAYSQLQRTEIKRDKVKRANFLDRNTRSGILRKMRDSLQVAIDLQTRYMDLNEFKRLSCVDIDGLYPLDTKILKKEAVD